MGELQQPDRSDVTFAARRKLAARRINERVKLAATSLNAIGLAIAGAAIIIPALNSGFYSIGTWNVVWLGVAIALHVAAHACYRFLRSED